MRRIVKYMHHKAPDVSANLRPALGVRNHGFYLFGSSDQTNNGSEISESNAVNCKCRK
jgi:hypothetical protein